MPERQTIERAREDAREGRSPSTQAGEFVREEIHHVREGKHGARSPQQAIAIGLSKARRAGVKLPAPKGSPQFGKKRLKMNEPLNAGANHRADVRGRRKRDCSMKVIAPPVRQHSLGKPNELRQSGESVRGAIVQRRLPTEEKRIPDMEGRLDFIRSPDRAVQRARRSDF